MLLSDILSSSRSNTYIRDVRHYRNECAKLMLAQHRGRHADPKMIHNQDITHSNEMIQIVIKYRLSTTYCFDMV